MKLKLDDAGHVVVSDGKPVYVYDDGKEVAFDAVGTVQTIKDRNAEAKTNRERAEAAEGKLKAFEGITDAEAARKALQTVANLDAKKLVDAGEVEKVRTEAIKATEDKYEPIVRKNAELEAALVTEKVGGSFSRSKFIADKLIIPSDIAQAQFGSSFKVEGDHVVAYDKGGNKIFSRANPGVLAGFDEALEILVESYPHKDHILKGSGANGGGASGGGNGGGAGSKSMTRAAYDKLSVSDQAAYVRGGGKISDGS